MSNLLQANEADWYEASARDRVAGLLDAKSFVEFLGPEQRAMSPHLAQFDLTGAFDDGIVVGRGRLDSQEVFVAAQEGLGSLIWNARNYSRTEWVFVGIITLGLLGFLFDRILRIAARTLLKRYGVAI